eukprot:scaffold280_cov391-Pavlova_lutheri.AAC.16
MVENLPLTALGHNAVLTVVDRFTKYAIYIPIHSTSSAHRQAECLMDSLVYRFHTPMHIHTDNRPAYRALFRAFCAALGVRHVTGTPYHSQSQGGAERQHRTLLQTLRTTCENKHQWDQYLQAAAHAYNDSVHDATKHSPFELLFGCQSRLPWHLQLPTKDGPADHLTVKVQYGLKGPTDKHKLDPYYVGPYLIKKVLKNGAYQLELPPGSAFSDLFPARPVRYWIESNLADAWQRFFWVDESSALLEEFLPLEENNGSIPQKGISPSNYDAVKTHKRTVYLQSADPIMINTWTQAKQPYHTRRRPIVAVPTNLIGCVVQVLFHLGNHKAAYYRGLWQPSMTFSFDWLNAGSQESVTPGKPGSPMKPCP